MAGNAGPTIQDVINEALSILGVYSGDPLDASDLQSAFFTFQAMVDGWAAEPLTFKQTAILQFVTSAGKPSYNLGTANTNDWVTTFLPQDFPAGSVQMVLAGNLELEVGVATLNQWEAIALKSLQSGILEQVWPDMGITAHTLNFWPVPNTAIPVNLYLPQQLAKPTSTTAALAAPAGYQEALTYELAIKCSSKFGAPIPAWLPEAWREAKSKLKAANFPILDVRCDEALLSTNKRTGGGSIDFYTGK